MIQENVYKYKHIYLNYSFTCRKGRPLVVVFSGVDSIPARCITSYYNYQHRLNASVLHIVDNFGAHGNYLLSISGDNSIRQAVCGLIRKIMEESGANLASTYLIGTSKGATSAMLYSLMIGGGTCIAGEPQVLLGDYLYCDNWSDSFDRQSVSYALCGRVNADDKDVLNRMIVDIFKECSPTYNGKILIHYGKTTGYHWRHIRHLPGIAQKAGLPEGRMMYFEHDLGHHNEIFQLLEKQVENNPIFAFSKIDVDAAYDIEQWKQPIHQHTANFASELEQRLDDGIHQFQLGEELPVDMLFQRMTEIGSANIAGQSNNILVCFNAAVVPRNSKKAPFFSGSGLSRQLNVPLISVSDPTLALDGDISIAWYAGNQIAPGLIQYLANILDVIADVTRSNLILFGGSSAGFAAVKIGGFLKCNATIVAWNPQTAIQNYIPEFALKYIQTAFPAVVDTMEKPKAKSEEPTVFKKTLESQGVVPDLFSVTLGSNVKLLYLQERDDWHVSAHALPYLVQKKWVRKGNATFLSRNENIAVHFGSWSEGHAPPPRNVLTDVLRQILGGISFDTVAVALEKTGSSEIDQTPWFHWIQQDDASVFGVQFRHVGNKLAVQVEFEPDYPTVDGLEFAFYFWVDGERKGTRWYEPDSVFETDISGITGECAVTVFVKDSLGQIINRHYPVEN